MSGHSRISLPTPDLTGTGAEARLECLTLSLHFLPNDCVGLWRRGRGEGQMRKRGRGALDLCRACLGREPLV